MKKLMTYDAFEEEYMNAVRKGTEMLCVWWTDEGDQVYLHWHPQTKDIHDQLAYETDMLMEDEAVEAVADWDMVFDGVLAEYRYDLMDAVEVAYDRYREEVGEEDDT